MYNNGMSVVEKDMVVNEMLKDELARCESVLRGLSEQIAKLGKGSLIKRKKKYKDRVYHYHCLKYRVGEKVFCDHVPNRKLDEVSRMIEKRRAYEKERGIYEKRIRYLKKVLSVGKGI